MDKLERGLDGMRPQKNVFGTLNEEQTSNILMTIERLQPFSYMDSGYRVKVTIVIHDRWCAIYISSTVHITIYRT